MFGFPLGSFPRPFLCRPLGCAATLQRAGAALPLSALPLAPLPFAALDGFVVFDFWFACWVVRLLCRTHITPLESRHQVPPFRHSLPLLVGIDSALEVLATGLWLEGVWLSRMPIFVGHRACTTPHTRGCHAFWAPCPFRFSPCTQIQHVSRNPVPSPTPCKHAIAIATTISHHITPRNYTTMGFTTLHYNTLHSTTVHYTPLHYPTLY